MNVTLRPYQIAAVQAILQAARSGGRRHCIQLPTGMGKTEIIAELCRIARFPMVLAPELAVMEQLLDRLELRLGERCDVEQGVRFVDALGDLTGGRRRVVVASRDTLLSRDRFALPVFDRTTLVVVDECHDGTTPAMERMLAHYERLGATILGVSATPYKGKGKPLRYWSRPCYAMPLRQALEEEWLAWPKVFLSEVKGYDLRAVEIVAGEWSSTQLEQVLMAEQAAQEVRSLVMSTYRQQPSVVYAHSVNHAKLLHDVLVRTEPGTVILHSHQSKSVREDNLKAFVTGEARIIINVAVLGMGWDHPALRNIYLAAPSRSMSRLEQRIGRGTRLLPGVLQPGMTLEERRAARLSSAKPTFNVYDITGTVGEHQFASIFDILDAKCREAPARRQRLTESLKDGEAVDPMEEIKQADAEEQAAREAELAALRDRRRQLVVGVNFDHRSHDIFGEPQEAKRRGWRMLYGPYRGQLLSTLPTSYLQHVRDKARKESPFIQGVRRELSRRMESQKGRAS